MVRRALVVLALAVAGGLAYVFFIAKPSVNPRFEPNAGDRDQPVISARGILADGGQGITHSGGVAGLDRNVPCRQDVVIVVHGFNNSADKALNRFGVARQALEAAGFKGQVVGFSWDADTQHDPYSATGYHAGREHSRQTGPILAQALARIRKGCPETRIALIGYSMGARLALEALLHLEFKIDSVHLVGAAMDNEEVELGERYGKAIEERAGRVINYFSPEDSKLGLYFWAKEGDKALGKADIEHADLRPRNFESRNAIDHLPEVNEATGELIPGGAKGKNHSGYLGTRNNRGELTDDGVMDLVAQNLQFK